MDINRSKESEKYPYQSIIDLYESNLPSDIVASQLDVSQKDVVNTLANVHKDKQNKEKNIIDASSKPKSEMINSVSEFDIENSIKDIQKRVWARLKAKPIFNINIKDTQKLLERVVNTDISLVILHVDVVNSTKLSMNLPLKRLAPIIQTFTQEMSLIVDAYGGYVFKFLGDRHIIILFCR